MTDLFAVLRSGDTEQRWRALDASQSFLVQAPAGSGKTDLLTRRFLKLLANVNEPEEILAITFTRAATGEMRARILHDLEAAAGFHPGRQLDPERLDLARAALAHAQRRGWRLLEQPERLVIETIDSLCLRIAHGQPLLSRLGGALQPTEQTAALYAMAARRTLSALGGRNQPLSNAIAHLLNMRDNNLPDCERLLSEMLSRRDQWEHAFPLAKDVDWELVRARLEAPFRREVRRVISHAYELLHQQPTVAAELMSLANYACSNRTDGVLSPLAGLRSMPDSEGGLEHWRCLCHFLLTEKGVWRTTFTSRDGLPRATSGAEAKQWHGSKDKVLAYLRSMPGLLETLRDIRELPSPDYDEDQWTTLVHLFTALRHAVGELHVLFAERNAVDFVELSRAALAVLNDTHSDRALAISDQLRHLLVDEFQDTSRRQHELISALLTEWSRHDGRTCFFVGDPMQSIYMFRQAEVELFEHVRRHGVPMPAGERHLCETIELTTNFRSHAGLVDPLNGFFESVFSAPAQPGASAVRFSSSTAADSALPCEAVQIHAQVLQQTGKHLSRQEQQRARHREAEEVLNIVQLHQPHIEAAQLAGKEYRVAVLVRSRQHLAEIVPLLREHNVPFRAVEIDPLSERQEFLDLLSLARALLHPMDRVAWLSVLRAPWCGLTLRDLHTLAGGDDPQWKETPFIELAERNAALLEPEARQRLLRTLAILKQAIAMRYRQSQSPSFASWIERTWITLGGPACLDAAARENTQVFFTLLDNIAPDGMALMTDDFEAEFRKLYAQPDPAVSERCGVQLMTIHKAKGLGFDVVIVPGMERKPAGDAPSLICSLERINPHEPAIEEFLVAPIGAKGGASHPLYKWVQSLRTARLDEERKRLFYVACTRARRELHLFGTAIDAHGALKPGDSKSLLSTAWPALQVYFEQAALRANVIPFPHEYEERTFEIAASEGPREGFPLRRLPSSFAFQPELKNIAPAAASSAPPARDQQRYERPRGSRQARIVGNVVHTLLQRIGPQLATAAVNPADLRRYAVQSLRAAALAPEAIEKAAVAVIEMLTACAGDPVARWILADHPEARSESSWTRWRDGELLTLRADRIFRAGAAPAQPGDGHLWIIDYKTSSPPSDDTEAFLRQQRSIYSPQLAEYATALHGASGRNIPVRLGLYYPRLQKLDWWSAEAD